MKSFSITEKLKTSQKTKLSNSRVQCFFGRNKSCSDSGEWYSIFTVIGPCHSFKADEPVTETGLFNGMYMQFDGLTLNTRDRENAGWIYLTHDPNVDPTLAVYYGNYLYSNSSVDVQASLTQVIISLAQKCQ